MSVATLDVMRPAWLVLVIAVVLNFEGCRTSYPPCPTTGACVSGEQCSMVVVCQGQPVGAVCVCLDGQLLCDTAAACAPSDASVDVIPAVDVSTTYPD